MFAFFKAFFHSLSHAAHRLFTVAHDGQGWTHFLFPEQVALLQEANLCLSFRQT